MICFKYDNLASVLLVSLLPYIVLCKSNDNPMKYKGNNMLRKNGKGIEDANNIIAEASSSPIPFNSDKVNG